MFKFIERILPKTILVVNVNSIDRVVSDGKMLPPIKVLDILNKNNILLYVGEKPEIVRIGWFQKYDIKLDENNSRG